jgi:hypothetical protein
MDPPKINYISNNSIMVVNKQGSLRQLFVPFKVQALQKTEHFKVNSWVVVEEVKPHPQFILLYRVINHWWPFFIFKIDVRF